MEHWTSLQSQVLTTFTTRLVLTLKCVNQGGQLALPHDQNMHATAF